MTPAPTIETRIRERFDSPHGRLLDAEADRNGLRSVLLDQNQLARSLRLDATTSGDDLVPEAQPEVGLLPGAGSRVVSKVSVVPIDAERIHAAKESSATEAAGKTAYGTALPESTIAFGEELPEFARVGSHINVTKGVWEDRGQGSKILNEFISRDVLRELDGYLLNESSIGILQDSAIPTFAKGGTRFDALVDAATRVRDADYTGTVTALLNPLDAKAMYNEKTSGVREFDRDVLVDMNVQVSMSSLAPSGSMIVADLPALATLFLRNPGLVLSTSDSHDANFVESLVTLKGELRAYVKVQRPSAGVIVTSF